MGAGLEGEGRDREEEHRSEGGEGGEAFPWVAGHGLRVARGVGGGKGIGALSTQDRGVGVRDFKGLRVGVRVALRIGEGVAECVGCGGRWWVGSRPTAR